MSSRNDTTQFIANGQAHVAGQAGNTTMSSNQGHVTVTVKHTKAVKVASYNPSYRAFKLSALKRGMRVWPSHIYGDSVITTVYYGAVVEFSIKISSISAHQASSIASEFSDGVDVVRIKSLFKRFKHRGEVNIEYSSSGFQGLSSAIITVDQAMEYIRSCPNWEVAALHEIDFEYINVNNVAKFPVDKLKISTGLNLRTLVARKNRLEALMNERDVSGAFKRGQTVISLYTTAIDTIGKILQRDHTAIWRLHDLLTSIEDGTKHDGQRYLLYERKGEQRLAKANYNSDRVGVGHTIVDGISQAVSFGIASYVATKVKYDSKTIWNGIPNYKETTLDKSDTKTNYYERVVTKQMFDNDALIAKWLAELNGLIETRRFLCFFRRKRRS